MQILVDSGYKVVINNRPDGESADQPLSSDLEDAAKAVGLVYHHIPMSPGRLDDETIAAFKHATESLTGPVHAFCRSGTRSATLWAHAQAHQRNIDTILEACAAVGYDLGAHRPHLEARASRAASSKSGA